MPLPITRGSRIEELERLTVLKEKGALNDAEFETEKRKVLGATPRPVLEAKGSGNTCLGAASHSSPAQNFVTTEGQQL